MIYYKSEGQGLPVVLLHGYAEDHSLWNNLSKALAQQFQVISIDLPGFGKSDRLNGSFSLDDVGQEIFGLLSTQLKLSEVIVFGHSLGGYVTLSLAENHSSFLKGFGLINSTALADSPEKKQNRLKTANFIRKHGTSFFLDNFVPNLFYERNRSRLSQEIALVTRMGKNLSPELLADYMVAMKNRQDRLKLLSEFDKVLFIGGEKDGGFSKNDYKVQISALKSTSIAHIFENVGHMSMYESPEKLSSLSISFLNSI